MFTTTSPLPGLPNEQNKEVKGNNLYNLFLPQFFFQRCYFLMLFFRRTAEEVEKATWLVLNTFFLKTWELDNNLYMWVCASASHLLLPITLLKINHLVETLCSNTIFYYCYSVITYWATEGTNAMWALGLITQSLNLTTHISRNPCFFSLAGHGIPLVFHPFNNNECMGLMESMQGSK